MDKWKSKKRYKSLSFIKFELWKVYLTKYLCVLIHIWIKGEVGAVKPV